MTLSDKQKTYFSSWKIAKLLWTAQLLSNLFFGMPLVVMVLFAADIDSSAVQQITGFYLSVVLFIYIPLNGFLAYGFLMPTRKLLNKSHEAPVDEEKLRGIGKLLNSSLYFSFITFFTTFFGFIFGLFILRLGLILDKALLFEGIIFIGPLVGLAICIIQSFLVYIFLENYFRVQIEKLPSFYFEAVKAMKIRKIPISWKIFFLTFFSVTIVQASLGALYLGRAVIYTPEDIKKVLIYISIVIALNLIYVIAVTVFFSRNLTAPLRKIIFWADKITKGEAGEEISIIANDEILEVIKYLKGMHEELESTKSSLKIKIKARTRELEEITEQQEEIIQKRIKEIQERAEELERFQRLAVGRELKMMELKGKIKELEERLKKDKSL